MKKILLSLTFIMFNVFAFGQLNTLTPEELGGYRDVYKISSPFYAANGCVRYSDIGHFYFLCGVSCNQFEKHMHTIYLGYDKETSIKTIKDLEALRKNIPACGVYVEGLNSRTFIYKVYSEIRFETDGIAGFTQVMFALKSKKIIEAIENFEE